MVSMERILLRVTFAVLVAIILRGAGDLVVKTLLAIARAAKLVTLRFLRPD